MSTDIRRAAVAAAGALALGVGAAAWATSPASAAPASAPACSTASLAVWVSAGQANGAAGTIGFPLEFTNISGRACTVAGYPGVSATGANGRQLGAAAARDPLFRARTVTIGPDGTAHAILFYADAEVFTSGCKPAAASMIRVFPPNQRTATQGFFSLDGCTIAKHHTYLRVTTIQPGARLGL